MIGECNLLNRWVPDSVSDTDTGEVRTAVEWQNTTCTTASGGGKLTKSGCGVGWNGGAVSKRNFTADIALQVSRHSQTITFGICTCGLLVSIGCITSG